MGNSDSRAEFRGLVETIMDVDDAETSALGDGHPVWERFWGVETAERDVFEFVQPDDVRRLLQNPAGVARIQTILTQAVAQMEHGLDEEKLSTASYAKLLNAIRITTRLLPFVLESCAQPHIFSVFWSAAPAPAAEENPAAAADDAADDAAEAGGSSRRGAARCLAERLLRCTGRLAFLPGFTLPSHIDKPDEAADVEPSGDDDSLLEGLQKHIIWCDGIGRAPGPSGLFSGPVFRGLNKNRYEVLKLLMVSQSEILYSPPSQCEPEQNPWIKFVSLTDVGDGLPFARELFCSLINTVCRHDALGWGIPYSNAIVSGEEDNRFADLCLHNLLIFLEVNSWANLHRRMLGDISSPSDFAFLYENLARLLETVLRAQSTYLPGSQKGIDSYQEVLVLLWKIFDSNKEFIDYVLRRGDVGRIVRPICFFLWRGRKRESDIGLTHICTFVALLLSGERNFGVALNQEVKDLPYLDGAPRMSKITHGDLLVIVLHKIIVDGDQRLHSLYNCFFTILSNISPYIKSFGQLASTRLTSLFERVSSRHFLCRAENNYQYVFFMLDLFNNVIQYQFEGNARLVYTLVLSRDAIVELAEMKFVELEPSSSPATAPQFTPTAEWFSTWKSKMPISTLTRMLDILVPQIEALADGGGASARAAGAAAAPALVSIRSLNERTVLDFIRETTLVGLLPVPHPIVIRRYQPNQYTTLWFTTYTWGVIYLRNQQMPLWDGNTIKLFAINLIAQDSSS